MFKNSTLEDVIACSYPPLLRDYIIGAISELQNFSINAQFFKVNRKSGNSTETIFNCKLVLPIPLNGKNFDITILIYLVKNFPIDPPEIYLERVSSDVAVNPNNFDVDKDSLQVSVQSMRLWVPYKSQITSIINEIIYSFSKNFPIYKKKTKTIQNDNFNNQYNFPQNFQKNFQVPFQNFNDSFQTQIPNLNVMSSFGGTNPYRIVSQPPNSIKNMTSIQYEQNSNNINYNSLGQKNPLHYNITNISNISDNFYPNSGSNPYSNNINNTNYPISNINMSPPNNGSSSSNNQMSNQAQLSLIFDEKLSEQEMKRNLIENLKISLTKKINDEFINLNLKKDAITSLKSYLCEEKDKILNFLMNSKEIIIMIQSQASILSDDINNLNLIIEKIKENEIDLKNIDSFLLCSNIDLLKIVSIESTIEEFITLSKKALEKGCQNLEEILRFIRLLSRELFKVKFIRDKIIKITK